VAHQIYKGCSSWIEKAGTSDSATKAEKRFKYEKEKRPEWIFNTKWCEGRPWLTYDRDENVMTCTICTKYGKRGETGNLKKLALEVEHEIEREFIKLNVLNEIKCYILVTLVYMPNTCRLVWNTNYMLSEISVKAFRSGRKLVGPAETDIV
jgi:hypothetical protein